MEDSLDEEGMYPYSEADLDMFMEEAKKLVIKADLKDSLQVLAGLFKDLHLPQRLERRIIESFLYANETVSSIVIAM